MNASLTPPEKSNIVNWIRKYYAKTSIFSVKVISHPITQSIKKKKKDCLFRVDPPVAYSADSD